MTESDFIFKFANKLNEQQIEAVKTIAGPVLLLAVPGSGKTTVLVTRLGYMLYVENILPENILTLTYTVAATKDMAERFTKLFGDDISSALEFRTINGICAKIINHYGNLIGKASFELITDEKISGRLLTDIYVKIMHEYPTESDIKSVKTLITYCKNMCLNENEIKKIGDEEKIKLFEIYKSYNAELRAQSLMDYDDQMIYAYRMLRSSSELLKFYRDKYKYICVDEAQDTSKIQHMIIALLSGNDGNLFMVGDEDQSIYGFRAAYPEALLNFEKEHSNAKVLIMDKNYRSNAKIVEVSDRFIQKNYNRHEKHMHATKEATNNIKYISLRSRESQYTYLLQLARDINEQTAILYRDNESILPLVDILERENVPYRIKNADMAFFTHRVVIDVINILLYCQNPCDPDLFMKIYFKFQTFLRKPDAERMCIIADKKHIGILDAAEYIDINKHVLGNLRALRTHFKNMSSESPSKAIGRIDKYMGYGQYLRDNNIDDNKLFILKMLAKKETTLQSFLERLQQLRSILADKRPDLSSNLILSTIHSSKGLEYDSVYLIDVINGVLPGIIIKSYASATPKEKKDSEEERRLFYVGMTRAKEQLCILKYDDKSSKFVGEISSNSPKASQKATIRQKSKKKTAVSSSDVPSNLIIGERIKQAKYGKGTISDVTWDDDDIPTKFTVDFDDGESRIFMYPVAFSMGMKIIH